MITRIEKGTTYRWQSGSWVDPSGLSKMLSAPPTLPTQVYLDGQFIAPTHLGIGENGYTLLLDNDETVSPAANLVLWINKFAPQEAQVAELTQKLGQEPVILIFGGNHKYKGEILKRIVEFYQAPVCLAVVSDKDIAYLKSFYKGLLIKADMGFDGKDPTHLEFLVIKSYELEAW